MGHRRRPLENSQFVANPPIPWGDSNMKLFGNNQRFTYLSTASTAVDWYSGLPVESRLRGRQLSGSKSDEEN
jgi:hypothetical protein